MDPVGREVLSLAIINLTTLVDFMILLPLAPQIVMDLKISELQYGFLITVFTMASAGSLLFSLTYVHRIDRRTLLLLAYFMFIVASFLNASATSYGALLVSRAITGASVGIVTSSIHTLLAEHIPLEMRGRASGILTAAISVSTIACVPAGLYLASMYGWRMPFLGVSIMAVLAFALANRFIAGDARRRGEAPMPSVTGSLFRVMANANLRWALMLTFFVNLAGYVSIPFLVLFLVGDIGVAQEQVPLMYFIAGCTTFLTTPLIGRLSDEFGRVRVLGYLTMGVTIGLVAILALPERAALWLVISSVAFLFVFNSGRIVSSIAVATSVPASTELPQFMVLNTVVTAGSIGLSTAIGGAILAMRWDGDLSAYAVMTMIAIVAGIVAHLTARRILFG